MAKSQYIRTTDFETREAYDAVTLDWTPLRELVGMELADWFMAMYVVRIDATTNLWIYRHFATRQYLHLATDGRVFEYAGTDRWPNRYRLADRAAIIHSVFGGWEEREPQPEDIPHFLAELERACEYAERGEPFPYSRADADERDEENRRFHEEHPELIDDAAERPAA